MEGSLIFIDQFKKKLLLTYSKHDLKISTSDSLPAKIYPNLQLDRLKFLKDHKVKEKFSGIYCIINTVTVIII